MQLVEAAERREEAEVADEEPLTWPPMVPPPALPLGGRNGVEAVEGTEAVSKQVEEAAAVSCCLDLT